MNANNLTLVLLLIATFQSRSQEIVQYKILTDDPSLVPSTYLDIMFFDVEGGMANTENWHKAVPGVAAGPILTTVLGGIKLDARLNFYYAGKKKDVVKLPLHLEAAAGLKLGASEKKKDVKVNVRTYKTKADVVTSDGKWLGTVDAIAADQITVKGTFRKTKYARLGANFRRSTYRPRIDGSIQEGSQSSVALFAGFEIESKVHVVTALSTGKAATSAQYLRSYFDVMVYPIATFSTNDRNKRMPVGFRVGATGQLPGMKIGFMSRMVPKVEFGLWPLDGWYWNAGFGFNLFRS